MSETKDKTFDFSDFIKYANDIPNIKKSDRAWAWYDCQTAFNNENQLDKKEIEYRAKELFIYLANWGMVARGSFVMQHTWRILVDVVKEVSKSDYNFLRSTNPIEKKELESRVATIHSLYNKIAKCLFKYHPNYPGNEKDDNKITKMAISKVSSRLITKILLGTTGSIVAYDNNVLNLISYFRQLKGAPKITGSGSSKKSIGSMYSFYFQYKEAFDNTLQIINTDTTHPEWTIMKLIDFCLWSYWEEYGETKK